MMGILCLLGYRNTVFSMICKKGFRDQKKRECLGIVRPGHSPKWQHHVPTVDAVLKLHFPLDQSCKIDPNK